MKLATSIFTGAALAAMGQAAEAATPKLKGVYTISHTNICQVRLGLTKDGAGKVTDINHTLNDKRVEEDIGTATFNDATKKVSLKGVAVFGDAVLLAGKPGTAMKEKNLNFNNLPYSNTDTTVTVFGGAYKVVYGRVVGGIVKYAVGVARNENCVLKFIIFQP
jgi:hypothetical protein